MHMASRQRGSWRNCAWTEPEHAWRFHEARSRMLRHRSALRIASSLSARSSVALVSARTHIDKVFSFRPNRFSLSFLTELITILSSTGLLTLALASRYEDEKAGRLNRDRFVRQTPRNIVNRPRRGVAANRPTRRIQRPEMGKTK